MFPEGGSLRPQASERCKCAHRALRLLIEVPTTQVLRRGCKKPRRFRAVRGPRLLRHRLRQRGSDSETCLGTHVFVLWRVHLGAHRIRAGKTPPTPLGDQSAPGQRPRATPLEPLKEGPDFGDGTRESCQPPKRYLTLHAVLLLVAHRAVHLMLSFLRSQQQVRADGCDCNGGCYIFCACRFL